jgi:hypothetical protein
MANFKCLECNIFFTTSQQRGGHHRLMHQSTCQICIGNGQITVNWSIEKNFFYPIDCYTRTFGCSDNLQSHFKVQYLEQKNSTLNKRLDDNV